MRATKATIKKDDQQTGQVEKPTEPTITNFLNKKGYFDRHFYLCKFFKTQQDAFDKVEEEYQEIAKKFKLDKKTMFTCYESFRNAKSNYYSVRLNRK